jgi:hypothetical protein
MIALGPIAQDPAYHHFADGRTILGVPNFLNVVSNVPFVVIGILGLRATKSATARVFFGAVTATAFGSAWYHLQPDDQTLFCDRLPMAVGFMALFALVIGDRLGERLAGWLSAPLIAAGVASVVCWRLTGDLRMYGLVQFFPLVAIPAMMLLFPSRGGGGSSLAAGLVCYAVAKLLELLDAPIFALGHVVSGHTLKHLIAAVATSFCGAAILGFGRHAVSWTYAPLSCCLLSSARSRRDGSCGGSRFSWRSITGLRFERRPPDDCQRHGGSGAVSARRGQAPASP